MKILYVCSGNFKGEFETSHVFIHEQMMSMRALGHICDLFLIKGKGIKGYLSNISKLRKSIKSNKYDVIHGIYGLSGILTLFQSRAKVVNSFIGSDTYTYRRFISAFVSCMSDFSIFVESTMPARLFIKKKFDIIPFGINLDQIRPLDKTEARLRLGFDPEARIVLFASSFNRIEKNYSLASQAIKLVDTKILVLELGKSFSREEINLIFNSADIFLMTSFHEGSPQVIKEAMACNLPIVTTDVGDVRQIVEKTAGCYITSYTPEDVASKIKLAFDFVIQYKRTQGRKQILGLEIGAIAKRIEIIYMRVCNLNSGI